MAKGLAATLRVIDHISDWTGRLVSWLLLFSMAILVYEVVARYGFNAPTIWSTEVTKRLFIAYYFLAGAYILYREAHVRVDIIMIRFPRRVQMIIHLFSLVCMFGVCFVLIRYGGAWAWNSLMRLEPDNTPFRAPIYPAKLVIPVAGFLLLLQGVADFTRHLQKGKME
jgi:TRAP-type mannitol/chloroaromatic compound transport system permease small subunit